MLQQPKLRCGIKSDSEFNTGPSNHFALIMPLSNELTKILRDVYLGNPLELRGNKLINPANNTEYDIVNSIPVMLHKDFITGDNRKYMKMYNWMYRGYDFAESFWGKLIYGSQITDMRNELMKKLVVQPDFKVLYVSIGTGTDIKILSGLTDLTGVEVYGADLSMGMLKRCKKRLAKWKINAELINCCAESLPFDSDSFDCVFHVGGINYFSDKSRAIREMVRVAKKGTLLLIADETEKFVKEQYQKNILSKKYFEGVEFMASSPVKLLPQNVSDVQFDLLMHERFYCITFRKE